MVAELFWQSGSLARAMDDGLSLQPASPARSGRPANRPRASTQAMDAGVAGSPRVDYDMAPGGSESPALPEVQALGEMLGAMMGEKLEHRSPTPYDEEGEDEDAARERSAAARARALAEAEARKTEQAAVREEERARRAAEANERLARQRSEDEEREHQRQQREEERARRLAEADERLAQQHIEDEERERQARRAAQLAQQRVAEWEDIEAADCERLAQLEREMQEWTREKNAECKSLRERAEAEAALLRERQAKARADADVRCKKAEARATQAAAEKTAQIARRQAAAEDRRRKAADDEARRRAEEQRRRREWEELELSLTLKCKPHALGARGFMPPPVYSEYLDGAIHTAIHTRSWPWLLPGRPDCLRRHGICSDDLAQVAA